MVLHYLPDEVEMNDETKSKQELITEVHKLRERIGDLEAEKIEQKQIEADLRKSEESFRNLFEIMSEGVVLLTLDGQIIKANHAAERILGLTCSEIEDRKYISPEWEILKKPLKMQRCPTGPYFSLMRSTGLISYSRMPCFQM